ncbi:hypothetical protein KDH_60650 [Dictyobacter sp. S3.2.2.5]|uniref:NodB homology domain-containing protein n=1 Tax=Dictyobacter halimunensis TaxID=3026934 RepID=A0ABQ6FY81_9CHLR|nr:hypothetical protein KDH_60650 [Dictyobacter sp. S3.2.2.5]
MYHSISSTTNSRFSPFTVSPELFTEQMSYLTTHGYTPITVTQFMQARTHNGCALPEKPVVLTFDDGFADFLMYAVPILRQFNFAATLYVSTAFLDGTSLWLRKEGETQRRMLTSSELRQVDTYGIECGGHTHRHPQLDMLPPQMAREEIVICKDVLEQILGHAVSSFAYPFGYYTPRIQQFVHDAGYISACAVRHMMSSEQTDPFALARLWVKPTTTPDLFGRLLDGVGMSTLQTFYLQMRTPVWRVVRRCSSLGHSVEVEREGVTTRVHNV